MTTPFIHRWGTLCMWLNAALAVLNVTGAIHWPHRWLVLAVNVFGAAIVPVTRRMAHR